jgi:hypothetical protein
MKITGERFVMLATDGSKLMGMMRVPEAGFYDKRTSTYA